MSPLFSKFSGTLGKLLENNEACKLTLACVDDAIGDPGFLEGAGMALIIFLKG